MSTPPLAVRFASRYGVVLFSSVLIVITPTQVRSQAARVVEWSEIQQGRRVQFVRDTLGERRGLSGTVVRKDATAFEVFSRQGQDTTTWRVPINSLYTMEVRDWRYNWKSAAFGTVVGALAGPMLVFSVCLEAVKCPQGGNGALVVTSATAIIGFAIGGQRRRWLPVRIPTPPPSE